MASTAVTSKPKTVFQLDSPFTEVRWPQTSPQNQQTILDLLCSILTPIGQYRSNHVTPSKGKRSRKRKREEAKTRSEEPQVMEVPPPPEISSHIVVGLNSLTRSLERLSQRSRLQARHDQASPSINSKSTEATPRQKGEEAPVDEPRRPPLECHLAVIFVSQPPRTDALNSHLPQLVATASLAHPELPATRLVQLPRRCDAQLCKALGLPRVSFIGILGGAPHCKALFDLIRECIAEVEVPWLQEVNKSAYLPVKIKAIETFAPIIEKKRKRG